MQIGSPFRPVCTYSFFFRGYLGQHRLVEELNKHSGEFPASICRILFLRFLGIQKLLGTFPKGRCSLESFAKLGQAKLSFGYRFYLNLR